MLAALLLLAAATVADTERAFAARAQRDGQWTAFRAYAAPDALTFEPRPVRADIFLHGRADPPRAVMWWPSLVYRSCDGRFAASTGPWIAGGGRSKGYFTTIWRRDGSGRWHWLLDHGDALQSPRRALEPIVERRAGCRTAPRGAAFATARPAALAGGDGASADSTLVWRWIARPVYPMYHTLTVRLWNGRAFETIVDDKVADE